MGRVFKLKGALCNRIVALKDRTALFEASVSPCVLYACGTWTMTASREHKLRCTRRRMLRWMIKPRRDESETWPEYIKRATHTCEDLATKHGSPDWVALHHKRKCNLAAKCALGEDHRWSCRLLHWRPWFRCSQCRSVGHPMKCWTDDF